MIILNNPWGVTKFTEINNVAIAQHFVLHLLKWFKMKLTFNPLRFIGQSEPGTQQTSLSNVSPCFNINYYLQTCHPCFGTGRVPRSDI
jgi:hypothetical protein